MNTFNEDGYTYFSYTVISGVHTDDDGTTRRFTPVVFLFQVSRQSIQVFRKNITWLQGGQPVTSFLSFGTLYHFICCNLLWKIIRSSFIKVCIHIWFGFLYPNTENIYRVRGGEWRKQCASLKLFNHLQ